MQLFPCLQAIFFTGAKKQQAMQKMIPAARILFLNKLKPPLLAHCKKYLLIFLSK